MSLGKIGATTLELSWGRRTRGCLTESLHNHGIGGLEENKKVVVKKPDRTGRARSDQTCALASGKVAPAVARIEGTLRRNKQRRSAATALS